MQSDIIGGMPWTRSRPAAHGLPIHCIRVSILFVRLCYLIRQIRCDVSWDKMIWCAIERIVIKCELQIIVIRLSCMHNVSLMPAITFCLCLHLLTWYNILLMILWCSIRLNLWMFLVCQTRTCVFPTRTRWFAWLCACYTDKCMQQADNVLITGCIRFFHILGKSGHSL